MKSSVLLLAIGCLFASGANAEVGEAGADHFLIGFAAYVDAPPAKVYVALSEVARWWSAEYTWSGESANLSLKPEAGGCFCERWATGSVEHGRVIMAKKNELLRLNAAIGPLQENAVNGVLTFSLKPAAEDTTELDINYRVNGSSASGLDQLAPTVDNMLAVQIDRLLRYIDTGKADEPLTDEPEEPKSRRAAREQLIEEWSKQTVAEQAAEGETKSKPAKPATPPKQ